MIQSRYRGLVLDFGGVLTTNFFAPFRAFCRRHGLPPDKMQDLMSSDPDGRELWHRVERGEIAQPEFEARLADMLGVERHGLVRRLLADLRPDEQMLAAVQAARKGGVRTGVLTNSWGTEPYDPYEPWQLWERLGAVVISHEVGLRKPDHAIYLLTASKLGIEPEACIFVDDIPSNLPAARNLGMAVIHHSSTADTIDTLEQLLGMPLRATDRHGHIAGQTRS